MSSTNQTYYRRQPTDTFPFKDQPSGRDWEDKHLQWLGIDIEINCAIEDVLPITHPIRRSGQIAQELETSLGKSWPDIIKGQGEHDATSIYRKLLLLGSIEEPEAGYLPSSQIGSPGSPARTSEAFLRERTPTTPSRSTMDPPVTPVPSPAAKKMATISTTPNASQVDSLHAITPSPFLNKTTASEELSPKLPAKPNSQETPNVTPSKNTLPRSTEAQIQILSVPNSDATYAPGSSSPVSQQALLTEDTSEAEVLAAARNVFELIEEAMVKASPGLNTLSSDPDTVYVMIGGYRMTAKPDMSLKIQNQKTTTRVSVECKRLIHHYREDQIQGQEVCEMLSSTNMFKANIKTKDQYTEYLVSWHHLNCYISRLNISDVFLDQLIQGDEALKSHPCVKRSRIFHLKDVEDRLEFAMVVAQLAVERLTMFNRNKALVESLLV